MTEQLTETLIVSLVGALPSLLGVILLHVRMSRLKRVTEGISDTSSSAMRRSGDALNILVGMSPDPTRTRAELKAETPTFIGPSPLNRKR